MIQLSLSYANPYSGDNASNLGWINFGNWVNNLTPGNALRDFKVTFSDGTIMLFDIENDVGSNCSITAVPISPSNSTNFGITSYTGITGNVVLQSTPLTSGDTANALFSFTNIRFTNSAGVPVPSKPISIANFPPLHGTAQSILTTDGFNFKKEASVSNPDDAEPEVEIINESPTTQMFRILATGSDADITYTAIPAATTILQTSPQSYLGTNSNTTNANDKPSLTLALNTPLITPSRGINLFL